MSAAVRTTSAASSRRHGKLTYDPTLEKEAQRGQAPIRSAAPQVATPQKIGEMTRFKKRKRRSTLSFFCVTCVIRGDDGAVVTMRSERQEGKKGQNHASCIGLMTTKKVFTRG